MGQPEGLSVMVYFWEADNPGVSDGRADGYLGDADLMLRVTHRGFEGG